MPQFQFGGEAGEARPVRDGGTAGSQPGGGTARPVAGAQQQQGSPGRRPPQQQPRRSRERGGPGWWPGRCRWWPGPNHIVARVEAPPPRTNSRQVGYIPEPGKVKLGNRNTASGAGKERKVKDSGSYLLQSQPKTDMASESCPSVEWWAAVLAWFGGSASQPQPRLAPDTEYPSQGFHQTTILMHNIVHM